MRATKHILASSGEAPSLLFRKMQPTRLESSRHPTCLRCFIPKVPVIIHQSNHCQNRIIRTVCCSVLARTANLLLRVRPVYESNPPSALVTYTYSHTPNTTKENGEKTHPSSADTPNTSRLAILLFLLSPSSASSSGCLLRALSRL
jgi:hypothetical protein